jgi:hypothetical protein
VAFTVSANFSIPLNMACLASSPNVISLAIFHFLLFKYFLVCVTFNV